MIKITLLFLLYLTSIAQGFGFQKSKTKPSSYVNLNAGKDKLSSSKAPIPVAKDQSKNSFFSSLINQKPASSKIQQPDPGVQEEKEKKSFLSGMLQLVAMGAGAPMLGDFEKFDDQGRAIFKLEANNLVDSKGDIIQTRAKYFNDGWTPDSEKDAIQPPGFFANLMSGGRLQEEWDAKNRITK